MYLQNVVPTGQTVNQELMLAIALCERILGSRGAVRVHGGGFGGTAQPLGPGNCHVVTIRPVGGTRLA